MKPLLAALSFAMSLIALPAAAQSVPPLAPASAGIELLMTATAEIEVPNDEAVAQFFYETQDADLTKAQGRVNQRVADGTAALKRADPTAHVQTSGYSSYPVYSNNEARSIVGWRVRQGVTLRTENLAALPRTVAAAQPLLALGGIDFRLSRAARERVDAQLIEQATAQLHARLGAAASAMGSSAAQLRVEEVNYGVREGGPQPMMMRQAPMLAESAARPAFEPGRSTERLTISGKARLLP